MGGSNWDEMLGAMTIGIASGGVCGIDDDDCAIVVHRYHLQPSWYSSCACAFFQIRRKSDARRSVTTFLLLFFFAAALSFADNVFCAGVRRRTRN